MPLNRLTRKGVPFEWTPTCQKTFEKLKENFVKPPILDFPDFSENNTFTLHTDASNIALGAVLSNKNGNPISFASRALNKAEKNYGTIEKELLAIVWSVKHYRPYLYGKHFNIFTDHKPLVYLFTMKDPSSRLTKFRLALEEYDFTVNYKKGTENVIADTLSRLPSSELKAMKTTEEVLIATRSKTVIVSNDTCQNNDDKSVVSEVNYIELTFCPIIKDLVISKEKIILPQSSPIVYLRGMIVRIKAYIKSLKYKTYLVIKKRDEVTRQFMEKLKTLNEKGMPDIIVLNENVKMIQRHEKAKKFVIMNDYHTLPTAGHAGFHRTLNTIKQRYTWPGMDNDVKEFIAQCKQCQLCKPNKPTKIPLKITDTSKAGMEKLFLDLVGPLINAQGFEYILTTQCDVTKFVTATPIANKRTDTVARAFVESVILKYGVPETICTDRGTEFLSELFSEVCKLLQIQKIHSTAYHHETIGSLENSHKQLGNFL
uniref:RNA-directed DNA polymerase n=1 Tax=Anopheles atroparvus TaxID=41427 RepID=A0AAG5D2B9_ANOAO